MSQVNSKLGARDTMTTNSRITLRVWPDDEQGLSSAESLVPDDFDGPCAVVLDGKETVVLPDYEQAAAAARLAVNLQIGGYGRAVVMAAKENQAITHQTAEEWLYG